ncbi:MAG: adenylate/guanylate cyclase domain-containing protein [Acidimicrobiales bacterium]
MSDAEIRDDGPARQTPLEQIAPAFVEHLEEIILGPARYTGLEVADMAGIPIDEAEQLWVELGFPPMDRNARRFTEADAEVVRNLRELQQSRLIPFETIVSMTRVLGQALSRVASAQVQVTLGANALSLPLGADGALTPELERQFEDAVALGVAVNERFIGYAWRRHLAAALHRQLDAQPTETVGFADMVGYTKLTRRLDDTELPALLERFQHIATTHVSSNGGRVVKLIGDAVMFVAPAPERAARAALGIRHAMEDHEDAPSVRIGLATGPVVALEGDVYGETVNRASRLAELARPDTILADDPTGSELLDHADITVRPLRPRRLKGIGLVRSWSVRTAPKPTD